MCRGGNLCLLTKFISRLKVYLITVFLTERFEFPLTVWVAATRLAGSTKGGSNRSNVMCYTGNKNIRILRFRYE